MKIHLNYHNILSPPCFMLQYFVFSSAMWCLHSFDCREADESRLREVCESFLGPPTGMAEAASSNAKNIAWEPCVLVRLSIHVFFKCFNLSNGYWNSCFPNLFCYTHTHTHTASQVLTLKCRYRTNAAKRQEKYIFQCVVFIVFQCLGLPFFVFQLHPHAIRILASTPEKLTLCACVYTHIEILHNAK